MDPCFKLGSNDLLVVFVVPHAKYQIFTFWEGAIGCSRFC
jgi:hypothetical protein